LISNHISAEKVFKKEKKKVECEGLPDTTFFLKDDIDVRVLCL